MVSNSGLLAGLLRSPDVLLHSASPLLPFPRAFPLKTLTSNSLERLQIRVRFHSSCRNAFGHPPGRRYTLLQLRVLTSRTFPLVTVVASRTPPLNQHFTPPPPPPCTTHPPPPVHAAPNFLLSPPLPPPSATVAFLGL